jgi:hypothetical protein
MPSWWGFVNLQPAIQKLEDQPLQLSATTYWMHLQLSSIPEDLLWRGEKISLAMVIYVRVPGYRPRGPGFDYRRYQIFWEVVGLERGPFSLVRIIEELLEWKSSGSGSRKPKLRPWGSLRWPRPTLYQLKLALNSPTGCGRSVGIVRLRTKKLRSFFFLVIYVFISH